ncbi:2OG-Fe(II) oxygenase superfamily-domain-containing protein [Dunaliella salina]|uniref:2OG-Fe(II) oxygenase superfamily-domain-containing protein n=1 Tax=Dunaliella salina TaxID=3046 RepID=A0ABQ7H659_DUNSA|nr:2OG-Fe(II) oxygenase superfamily-domain-containing protein [Dunaliella salina]|eukprot:KAF5842296.1 2OG-Fe(II) oxygenase superfamily-domain-containing protein [Dunaliella salina]
MHKNSTHLVKGDQSHKLEKSHVHEAELSIGVGATETQMKAPLCANLGQDTSLATMLSLFMPDVKLDSQAIKLQYNEGEGGCFPLHIDSDPTVDTRVVTAIFYLNPSWQPHNGGLLQLYRWPFPPVSIEPLHGRLVLFPSQRMIHRVTPYNIQGPHGEGQGRCCFTIWMSQSPRARRGKGTSSRPQPLSALQPKTSPEEDPEAAIQFLMTPQIRPHAAKMALSAEWLESLQQSHLPGPALDAVVQKHEAEVGVIRKVLDRYEGLVRQLTQDPDSARRYLEWF